jgi:NAD(P)-dependent dehydrogenase (short-subunit alcohol dehydrogenase family)
VLNEEQVAIITGSGSGIGEGIAKYLAAKGVKVVINDLAEDKVERIVVEIQEAGGTALGITANVTDVEQVTEMTNKTLEKWGRIDILVNNAGIARDKSIRKMTEEDWDIVLEVNLKSAFLCSKAVVEPMIKQNYGRIINISSRAWLGWFGQANYSASKGGLVSLTRTLAIELGKRGITANTISPGLIDTPLLRSVSEEIYRKLLQAQPSGKVGSIEDVARAVAFFADRKASFMTGQVFYVCGGKSLFARPAM